jgi:hypothetical protein
MLKWSFQSILTRRALTKPHAIPKRAEPRMRLWAIDSPKNVGDCSEMPAGVGVGSIFILDFRSTFYFFNIIK